MKNIYLIPLLVVLCCWSLDAQQAHGLAQQDDLALEDQLVAQVDIFMHAWKKQDAATLMATMAPEFLYVTSRGVTPRDGVVGALTHACTLTSYGLSDVRVVRISTDSATLLYRLAQSASCMGHPDPPVVLNTDTLVRRGGRWMFLVTTSTSAQ